MASSLVSRKIYRKNFGKRKMFLSSLPDLNEVQKNSYNNFLQINIEKKDRREGLHEIFKSVFPINDYSGNTTLEYDSYEILPPKFDVNECKIKGISYASPLVATLRLILWETDEESKVKDIKSIKEQDVYLGDIPLMTEHGTFIINGIERVIVSQMHRSPGVFFDHDEGKTHSSGKYLYNARIIPYRGSWLDFEYDPKDLLYFRIDRKKKMYVSTLLRALGLDTQGILSTFYNVVSYKKLKLGWSTEFTPEKYRGVKLIFDLVDAKSGKVFANSGTKMTVRLANKFKEQGLSERLISDSELEGCYLAENIVDSTGKIIFASGEQIIADNINPLKNLLEGELKTLAIDHVNIGSYLINTILADKNTNKEEALADIFKVMRPGEPVTLEASEKLFTSLFFDKDRYDLSSVGRMKLNARLNLSYEEEMRVLTKDDVIEIVKILVKLRDGAGDIDDIDHLGNRRVRSVGELVENQFRIGLVRMERAIIERMTSVDVETVMPHDLVNSKTLSTVLKEFFGTSQLSQFMDQTNPLSEITHKRRISALGPGGLSRERAGFEVRDVHPTHYGRICPIETPEGQNIGLINSMATYARINKYGFIESPYRKVIDGKITDEITYLSAIEEGRYHIAQSDVETDKNGNVLGEMINCRHNLDFVFVPPKQIDFVDISPMQLVSVAAALIPFLENDDANRALMGSNMQRQAVPLVRSTAPFVGTGIESVVAKDSGAVIVAKKDGIVEQVDSNRIVISSKGTKTDAPGVDIYNLMKFVKSNHSTCINQKPIVKVGERIAKGDVIADGPCTESGELALGRNVLCGFMSWNGYNFEDSILISEHVVHEDVFSSIHIEEFEVTARDTRLGPEEITRDIPHMSDEGLRQLDEIGVVHIGAEVKPGDILVGKVTPKSESPVTPEEKLLRAIFGEKAADVKDSSLYVPPGVYGTIVDVQILSRRGVEKDARSLSIERAEIERLTKDRDDELRIIREFTFEKLKEYLLGKSIVSGPKGIKAKTAIDEEMLEKTSKGQWWQFEIDDESAMKAIKFLKEQLEENSETLNKNLANKIEKVKSGDDLPQGALKVVKVFIAVKHKLQPGDKMAGRHGNKGVVSKICPIEDMPFLEDGRTLDIILNPLGVPSRMNVGQILETHLGAAAVGLGRKISELYTKAKEENFKEKYLAQLREKVVDIYAESEHKKLYEKMGDEDLIEATKKLSKGVPFATPVFDGVKWEVISDLLAKADLPSTGKSVVYDGRTGDPFDRPITVGYIYMLKLHHLVDDKIHARSIGPYSLVTQQPLGGKSHFGGQRFGEMECWALQAYGAAYTLQEMLTVKSDDVVGRIKIYESIIRGDHSFESGVPESFNVMVKELRSLCLNFELESDLKNEDNQ